MTAEVVEGHAMEGADSLIAIGCRVDRNVSQLQPPLTLSLFRSTSMVTQALTICVHPFTTNGCPLNRTWQGQ